MLEPRHIEAVEGMTTAEAAELYCCTPAAINAAARRYGLTHKLKRTASFRKSGSNAVKTDKESYKYSELKEFTCYAEGCNNKFKKEVAIGARGLRFFCSNCLGSETSYEMY